MVRNLEEMDAVLMRKDPPVNVRYLYVSYILDLIDPAKTLVINSPQGLRNDNEKMYTFQFLSVMPETMVAIALYPFKLKTRSPIQKLIC